MKDYRLNSINSEIWVLLGKEYVCYIIFSKVNYYGVILRKIIVNDFHLKPTEIVISQPWTHSIFESIALRENIVKKERGKSDQPMYGVTNQKYDEWDIVKF